MSNPPAASICPLCGRPNHCAVCTGTARCWCFEVEIPPALLAQIPAAQRDTSSCICRDCVEAFARSASTGTKSAPDGPSG